VRNPDPGQSSQWVAGQTLQVSTVVRPGPLQR
jgi:hypothetical protein